MSFGDIVKAAAGAMPIVGPILDFAGGLLRDKSAGDQADQSQAIQREFAQSGIRWRVADAKAAGLHPLFALGGATTLYSPPPITTGLGDALSSMGQNLSRSVQAQESELEREVRLAQIRQANAAAEKDLALAAATWSEDARRAQERGQSNALPMPGVSSPEIIPGQAVSVVSDPPTVQAPPSQYENIPGLRNVVKMKPAEVTSANQDFPYIAAGPAGPGSKRYHLSRNMEVLLPDASSMGEALESISESFLVKLLYYRLNVAHYGQEFTDLAFQELGIPTWPLKMARKAGKAFEPFDYSLKGVFGGPQAGPEVARSRVYRDVQRHLSVPYSQRR